MFLYLLILFISIPLIELIVILKINALIGFDWTIIIIILTGIAGSYLARKQGKMIILRIREEISQGTMPKDRIIEGLILFVGGFMLLFPGYITDFIGFMLMVPGNRRFLREYIKKWIKKRFDIYHFEKEV